MNKALLKTKRLYVVLLLMLNVGLSITVISASNNLPNTQGVNNDNSIIDSEFQTRAEQKRASEKIILAGKSLSSSLGIKDFDQILAQCSSLEMQEKVYGIVSKYYPAHISSIEWKNGDLRFIVHGREIWYADGRLLSSESLQDKESYRSILYPYSTDSIYDIFKDLPKPRKNFSANYVRSSDFQISLVGGTPTQIESKIKEYRILGFGVRLHPIAAEAALKASKEVLELAKDDIELQAFLDGLKTISGFVNRKVSGSTNISMHGFGFAFDFIPHNYYNKVSYWQWAKKWYPDEWDNMPLDRRWLINQKLVVVFEKHGFIWGGKWPHYDTMHLEYRPELIGYAEARKITGSPARWRQIPKQENL